MEPNLVCNHMSENKSSDCTAGVQFVYHKYDYRLNWMTQSLNQLINDKYNFQKKKRIAKF